MSTSAAHFVRERDFKWSPSPRFGWFLRDHRQAMGLTIKEAAAALGVSYSGLGKTERGERAGRPSFEFIRLAADLFDLDFEDVCAEAGYEEWPRPPNVLAHELFLDADGEWKDVPDPVYGDIGVSWGRSHDLREEFRRVVCSPELISPELEDEHIGFLGERVMSAWLDFASNLERHLKEGGLSIEVLRRRPWEGLELEEQLHGEPGGPE